MTEGWMDLPALLERSADADLLCGMIGVAAETPMEMAVGALARGARGETAPLRTARRTGGRARNRKTRAAGRPIDVTALPAAGAGHVEPA